MHAAELREAQERPGKIRVRWLIKGLGPGGAERLLVSTAATHDRSRFDLGVVYLLPWKDQLVAELEQLDVPCTCLDVRDERDLRWSRRLRSLLLEDPTDILHAHSPYAAGIGRLVARSVPRRIRPALVYTTHNTWTSFTPPTRWLNGATMALD